MKYLGLISLSILLIPFLYGINEADAANWYNSSWLKARKITVDDSDITADLTNYPLYVNLTSVNIGTDAQADCDDFVFTNYYNTTKLDHEVESCDSTLDWAEFWVDVPTVFNANATVIYMYYDNSGAADQQNTQAVWNSDFAAVWHLNGTFNDSTANAVNCANSGSSAVTDEYIGDSRDFDGVDDNIDCASPAAIDNIWTSGGSMSAWIKPDTAGESNVGKVVDKSLAGSTLGWRALMSDPSGTAMDLSFRIEGTTDGRWDTTSLQISNTRWQNFAINYNKDSVLNDPTFYINGSSVSITEVTGPPVAISSDATVDACIGNSLSGLTTCDTTTTFDGKIDEVRLYSVQQTTDWFSADWQCQRFDGSCITIGSQGVEPTATVTVSDEGAGEDTASYTATGTVTVSDEGAVEDTGSATIAGTITISDEGAGEDQAGTNLVTVSDEGAGEDSPTGTSPVQNFNTIVLRVVKNPFEFGVYSDASRMVCNSGIKGGVIFNTNDNNLNICDGTTWRLPNGTAT